MNQAAFATISNKLPVLWIRGADDQIVSNTSLFDFGFLGQLGAVPGWPGAEVYPPQPMIAQIHTVMNNYAANGGEYQEVVLPDCGHSPHIEKQETVLELFDTFMQKYDSK
jgi:pimeloyl-ACP methyl ester carboxylesterase